MTAAHVHNWVDDEGPNRICSCGHIEPIPAGNFALGRSTATTGSGLTDYDKGYLDGLLQGTASAGDKWSEVYEAKAKAYLDKRGFKGWKVNAKRI